MMSVFIFGSILIASGLANLFNGNILLGTAGIVLGLLTFSGRK